MTLPLGERSRSTTLARNFAVKLVLGLLLRADEFVFSGSYILKAYFAVHLKNQFAQFQLFSSLRGAHCFFAWSRNFAFSARYSALT